MLNKVHLILLFLILPLVSGCDRKQVYREFVKIPDYSWERDHTITYETEISDTDALYDLDLEIRHSTYFPYSELIVVFRIVSPSGATRSGEHVIPIRDEKGGFYASGMGDIWDLSFPVAKAASLNESGTYRFEVDNVMPRVRVDGLMSIGLKIKKSKVEIEKI